MAYPISTTKLITYQTCAKAYELRFERGLGSPAMFGSPDLGNALHKALAMAYRDWHYNDHKPTWDWFENCWTSSTEKLSEKQIQEGCSMLEGYYSNFIAPLTVMARPLGVESRIRATVQFGGVQFVLTGRYDRLDYLAEGLDLFEFKSGKNTAPPEQVDIRLGVYSLALLQTYQKALKRVNLVFLRSRETLSYDVDDSHREQVQSLIANLALKLRNDNEWEPSPGHHCERCGFAKYCPAQTDTPEPLPETGRKQRVVQLALAI